MEGHNLREVHPYERTRRKETTNIYIPNLIYPTYGTFKFAFSGSDNSDDDFNLDLHFAVHGKLIIMQVTGKATNFTSSNRNFSCTITAGLRPSSTMIGTSQISQFIPTYKADTSTPEIESDINGLCTVSSSGVVTIWKEAPPGTGAFDSNGRGWPPFTLSWLTEI